MSFPRYPEYKDSGVEWLGVVPTHWVTEPLKRHCHVMPSNIDKKSVEGEPLVLLCNYTDVYYHDEITMALDFMKATASRTQIQRFTLRKGDVVFTKDSESADDIAIPAFVPSDLPGVVCGYHLAIARSAHTLHGKFLKWYFDSQPAKAYFCVSANGLTRVGLSQYASDNLSVPVPPFNEQALIAAFLDHETARIDALVAEQQRLIELLKEKRQAVISHAVTKGLNPDVPMKDSGVEWLGEVPAHWVTEPLKRHCHVMPSNIDKKSVEGEPLVLLCNYTDVYYHDEITMALDFMKATASRTQIQRFTLRKGDVVFTKDSESADDIAIPAFVPSDLPGVVCGYHLAIARSAHTLHGKFLKWYFDSQPAKAYFCVSANGLTRVGLSQYASDNLSVPVPPFNEQALIAAFLDHETARIDALVAEQQRLIELLKEKRQAVISHAVTGKIDVRGWQPPQGSTSPTETTVTEPA